MLSQNLRQQQKLQQKLSPQQIQYIKLLQLPTLALEQRIKEELETNPLLEEGAEQEDDIIEDPLSEQPDRADAEQVREADEREPEGNEDDEYDWEELLNNADDLYGYKARPNYSSDEEEHRDIPMPAQETMAEHLRDQLTFLDLDEKEEIIADQIIGSIDEDGYLRRPLESIVDDIMFNYGTSLTEADVEDVLARIQRLDPIGIAARDLKECLLIQLYEMPEHVEGRDIAIGILEEAYKAFTMKHFGKIQKKLTISKEELKQGFDLIQRLNPKPGEGDFTAQQNYITPDFTVRYVDGEFIITLNGRNAPQLRVSRHYRRMLEKLSAEKKKRKKKKKVQQDRRRNGVDDDTRKFLKNKFESARWFINSINQRRHTMMKVMNAILELQEDFFLYGEGNLKPMILKDVAEIIDMDISTVSRVVNGKYVQTDFGVYELKYFFSEGLSTESGEEVSNKEVRAIIEEIVAHEDKQKPLSDQKIADKLEERGFQIARRTVTKYRKQLHIPVARLRKEIILED
jgi:RNA polymerase sigma-54 factor